MMRIKLFGLFIAYAMVALVRPREMRKMLEAADRGAATNPEPALSETQQARLDERRTWSFGQWAAHVGAWENAQGEMVFGSPMAVRAMLMQYGEALVLLDRDKPAQECPRPPAGRRCTRRAGHDGPCAAVEVMK